MCGRFTLTIPDLEELIQFLNAEPDPGVAEAYRPRYNIPPTDPHVIVTLEGNRHLIAARWGFGRDGEKPQINARAETAGKIGLFKRAFREKRCIVPADGFYEWIGDKKTRRPIWFHKPGQLLLFGGIWQEHPTARFAILTTRASEDVAPVHDRMPVIIPPAEVDRWLTADDPAKIAPLLEPAPKGFLIATPVSPRVNSVANDDPACLAPPDPELF